MATQRVMAEEITTLYKNEPLVETETQALQSLMATKQFTFEVGISLSEEDTINPTITISNDHVVGIALPNLKLTQIPDALIQFPMLEKILLAFNDITSLTPWLLNFTHLKEINLSHNRFEQIDYRYFPPSVEGLRIAHNQLVEIPQLHYSLESLRTLDLEGNRLLTLPDCLKDMPNVLKINLNGNMVSNLQNWDCLLTNLETIQLANNRITKYPEFFRAHENLKNIDLSYNKIKILPDWLKSQSNIVFFNISNNPLIAFENEFFQQWTSLTELNMSNINLTVIPPSLDAAQRLIKLLVNDNHIRTVECLNSLASLQWVEMNNNHLSMVPIFISKQADLKTLELQNNKIDTIPESLFGLSLLFNLNLSMNRIRLNTNCPTPFTLKNLSFLDLSWNELTFIPPWFEKFKNLNNIRLNNNRLEEFPPFLLKDPVKHIDLSNNQIRKLWDEKINQCRLLGCKVNLKNNPIDELPFTLPDLWEWIALDENRLHNLLTDPPYQRNQKKIHIFLEKNLIRYVGGYEKFKFDFETLFPIIRDMEVDMDFENCDIDGFYEIEGKFFYIMASAGGDWEVPVSFIIYQAPSGEFRNYIPKNGNPYNKHTNRALGNDDDADYDYLVDLGYELKENTHDCVMDLYEKLHDEQAMHADISQFLERLEAEHRELERRELFLIAEAEANNQGYYHGSLLTKGDFNVIMTLERQIGVAIPKVDRVPHSKFGFTANKNRIQQLGLFQTGLTALPKNIGDLTALQILFLNENTLEFLPETIGNLTTLEELWIDQNVLASLPDSIGQLTSLKKMSLKSNQLISLPKNLEQLTALETLYLESNKFTSLPEWLGNLKSLEYLNLGFNQLISLPERIGNLAALKCLWLDENQLVFLPECIGNLAKLKVLTLANNSIVSLPDIIGKLTELEYLDLSGNKLTYLPDSIGKLTALYAFDLKSNRLTSLPNTLGQLTVLKTLELGINRLTALPASIGNLKSLTKLNLECNQLYSLPDTIGQLTTLETLTLRINRLISLPDGFFNLTSLKKLSLAHNKFISLPASIGKLPSLRYLDLNDNKLESLPEWLGNLESLNRLDLQGNASFELHYSEGKFLSSLPESIDKILEKLKRKGCSIERDRVY